MSVLLLSLITLFSLLGINAVDAVQISKHTEQKSMEIELDSTSDDLTKEIDLSKYSIAMPEACTKPNVSCNESTKVYIKLTKSWEITTVQELTDPKLSSTDFSLYYPNIPSDTTIDKNSDPKHILLLQRALYERGLLPVLPTGRYGAQTELALLHFNQIKGIGNCTDSALKATKETITELNAMKGRMANPEYLQASTAPAFNETLLCEPQQKRVDALRRFITAANAGEIKQTLKNTKNEKVEIAPADTGAKKTNLEIEGFVKIKR